MNTPSLTASDKLHAQFRRTHLSQRDFQEASEYAHAYSPELAEPVRRALQVAAVVAYARPFTKNEGSRGAPAIAQIPLDPKSLLDPEEHVLHLRLLELRHEALAHSQYSRKPIGSYELRPTGHTVQGTEFDILDQSLNMEAISQLCNKWALSCKLKKVALARSDNAA